MKMAVQLNIRRIRGEKSKNTDENELKETTTKNNSTLTQTILTAHDVRIKKGIQKRKRQQDNSTLARQLVCSDEIYRNQLCHEQKRKDFIFTPIATKSAKPKIFLSDCIVAEVCA